MKKLVTLTAALSVTLGCMAAKPVQLSLNLKEGCVYRMGSEASITINQNVFGQTLDIDMLMNGSFLFKVEKADVDGYDMSVWYERLAMKMDGMMEMEADSDNLTEADPFSTAIKSLTGKPFSLRMARSGKIVSIEGVEDMMVGMVSEMAEKFPEMDEAQIEMLKNQMSNSYGGDSFKGNIEAGMVVFPDKPVSVGDSWSNHIRMHSQFTMDVEVVFTVVKIAPRGITIKSEALLATDPDEDPTNLNGMEAKYNLEGAMTSETVIDPASGWTVSGRISQDMSGNVTILPGEQMPDGFTLPMTIKTDMTVTGSIPE